MIIEKMRCWTSAFGLYRRMQDRPGRHTINLANRKSDGVAAGACYKLVVITVFILEQSFDSSRVALVERGPEADIR